MRIGIFFYMGNGWHTLPVLFEKRIAGVVYKKAFEKIHVIHVYVGKVRGRVFMYDFQIEPLIPRFDLFYIKCESFRYALPFDVFRKGIWSFLLNMKVIMKD